MKYPITLAAFTALVILDATSCYIVEGPQVRGSGLEGLEERSVDEFDRISISSIVHAVVHVGDTQRVVLSGDDNILPFVRTSVSDGKLTISMESGNYSPRLDLVAEISLPNLRAMKTSGAASAEITGIDADHFELGTSGASTISASGHVEELYVRASGASDLNLYELESRSIELRLSGASEAEIHATDTLEARASGASSIRYRGAPAINVRTTGASSLRAE